MRIEGTIRSLRVMLRANTIIAGIHGRHFAARSGLAAFAALVGAFGLLMLGLAIFFALELVWGRVWAAVAVGVFNVALAVSIGAIAARLKPGRELAIATEVRDAAVDSVTGDLRTVESDIAALAHAVRHPLDSTIAALATPLVAMLIKAVKGSGDAAEVAEPRAICKTEARGEGKERRALSIVDSELIPLLSAVVGRIIPADADPGALEIDTDAFVRAMLAGDAAQLAPLVEAGLRALAPGFISLSAEEQDARLALVAGESWFRRLAELTADGFYADPTNGGNRDAASWRMVGYHPRLPEGLDGPPPQPRPAARAEPPAEEYDAIVVGAGAGGGIAACVLAEAGKRVLLLERGVERTYANSGHRDHLRNHRATIYGHNTGPDIAGNPRVAVGDDGVPHTISPLDPRFSNNASTVGGGTLVYGMQAWRFLPDDFRMASRYGVPEGSSLADWPISYADLEPWYERAEWEIGVAGEDNGNRHQGPRRRGYPMPPVPRYEQGGTLQRGAAALGISTFTTPLLLNSVPRAGRAACIECGSCVGFPCPSNAKNGTQNTVVPRALATGHCDLRTGAVAERIDTDADGRVTGITYATSTRDGIAHHKVRAAAVVLACGAIETARLLLLSRSAAHPAGIGNANDLVGRNLQGHYYPGNFALFDHDLHESRGPGVTISSCDFSHGNPGVIGGAMMADDFIMLPSILWRVATPPHLKRWGSEAKDFMRRNYRRITSVRGPVQEIPNPECRVTLDPDVTDALGLPVARLSGKAHEETLRTSRYIRGKSEEWLKAAGAVDVWGLPIVARLSAGQHQAGTCRMGADPATSVTDPWARVWGHDNLVICDGSVHPTNGGMNPVLTIMALAFRHADALAREM